MNVSMIMSNLNVDFIFSESTPCALITFNEAGQTAQFQ